MKWVDCLRPFAAQSLELDHNVLLLNRQEFDSATDLYRSVRFCDSRQDAEFAARALLLAQHVFPFQLEPAHLLQCSRLRDFGRDRWSALEVCMGVAMLCFGEDQALRMLHVAQVLLADREECRASLRMLAGLMDHSLLRHLALHLSPAEPNCDHVLQCLLECTNWYLTPNRRGALIVAAIQCESSFIFESLDRAFLESAPKQHFQSAGNGPAAVLLAELPECGLSVDVMCEEERYVALCGLFKHDRRFADLTLVSVFACTTVHPVTVLALMQLDPRYEIAIRARAPELAPKLLRSRMPELSAWLLNSLQCNPASLAIGSVHAGPLLAWRLVEEEKVAHLLPGNPNLVWRAHTHRYFPAEVRRRVRWLLCLLRCVFPRANRDIRELLIEYVIARRWYERRMGAPPSVDLDAPWKVVSLESQEGNKRPKGKDQEEGMRMWRWIDVACVASVACTAGWLLFRKK